MLLNTDQSQDVFWHIENYEFHLFDGYLAQMDSFLDKEIEKHKERIESAKSPPPGMSEEFFDGQLFELNDVEYALSMFDDFRNRFLKSFIISLYSLLESSLAERCKTIQQRTGHSLSAKDLTGKGIEQSMNYLTKVHGLTALKQLAEWQQLQDIRRLRNCIAHNDGRLNSETDQVQAIHNYISRESTLSIETIEKYDGPSSEVALTREYCQKTLLTVKRFLYAVDVAIGATGAS